MVLGQILGAADEITAVAQGVANPFTSSGFENVRT